MSSADKCQLMTSDNMLNLLEKVRHYVNEYCKDHKHQKLKLVVYGDQEPFSYQMWASIFRDDLMHYEANMPPISIPPDYTSDRYQQYKTELNEYVTNWAWRKKFIYGLYDLAIPGLDPRMHLVITNRKLKRSECAELGYWAETDKSELRPDNVSRDFYRCHSSVVTEPGSVEGSYQESSAGHRSYEGRSTSSLILESVKASQDPLFIPIAELLRKVAKKLLDFNPFPRILTVESTTLSSLMDKYRLFADDRDKNIVHKMNHYLKYRKDHKHQELILVVYGDKEPVSHQMWKSIFRDNVMYYAEDFDLIPIPPDYNPKCYKHYEQGLKICMSYWDSKKKFIYGVYNLAVPGQDPRMHLVFTNRKLKRSECAELGCWPETDKPELKPYRSTPRTRYTVTDLYEWHSGVVGEPGSAEGSYEGSGAGGRSSEGRSASNLSLESVEYRQDPRFIPIAILRDLVWELLDFDPMLTVESSTSSSTSSDVRSSEFDQPL